MVERVPSVLSVLSVLFVLGVMLPACGQGDGSSPAGLVAFDALVANPGQYAGQYVCTEGVQADGFESSGLAAATYQSGGTTYLTEPVIWLEGADIRSRQDCVRTDTQPPYEFCRAVACGVFETGGGFGHTGAYGHQLRGRDA
jgi:hypothetical protein